MSDGTFLSVNYERPGAILRFDSKGKVLWQYGPTSGPNVIDHPSLAAPLPNGLVAVCDDFGNRVQIVDPKRNKVVWQYGTGVAGAGRNQLWYPDGLDLLLPGGVTPLHLDFPTDEVRKGVP